MLIISNLEYNFFQIETTRVQRESLLYLWILDIEKTNENRGGQEAAHNRPPPVFSGLRG